MNDLEFARIVKRERVAKLKKMFPNEARSHGAMLQRGRKADAQIASDIRSFRSFLLHLGRKPSPDYTVDRINSYDPEYAIGKIRWASKAEQSNNRRNTIYLRDEEGIVLPLATWAKRTNQNPATLRQRKKRGWADQDIIAGRHLTTQATIPTKRLKRGSWPENVRSSDWEAHYQSWLKARVNPLAEDTREVFFSWIEQSRTQALLDDLEQLFPDSFGSESSPDNDDHSVDEHPAYRSYLDCYNRLRQVTQNLSEAERANLSKLKRRRISDPRSAVISEQRERSRFK